MNNIIQSLNGNISECENELNTYKKAFQNNPIKMLSWNLKFVVIAQYSLDFFTHFKKCIDNNNREEVKVMQEFIQKIEEDLLGDHNSFMPSSSNLGSNLVGLYSNDAKKSILKKLKGYLKWLNQVSEGQTA